MTITLVLENPIIKAQYINRGSSYISRYRYLIPIKLQQVKSTIKRNIECKSGETLLSYNSSSFRLYFGDSGYSEINAVIVKDSNNKVIGTLNNTINSIPVVITCDDVIAAVNLSRSYNEYYTNLKSIIEYENTTPIINRHHFLNQTIL